MTAPDILARAHSEGLTIALDPPDRLRVTGPAKVRAEILPLVREHKAELVALLSAPRWRWLITHALGEMRSHSFNPEATLAQVRGWYPDALTIAPEDDDDAENLYGK